MCCYDSQTCKVTKLHVLIPYIVTNYIITQLGEINSTWEKIPVYFLNIKFCHYIG